MGENKIHLTSSEIAGLWTGYMNDSMARCMLRFMLKDIQDSDIKPVLQHAYDISAKHLEQLEAVFEDEKCEIPVGFTESDINMDAPWLFTDLFCLTYVNHMAKVGMITYSGFSSMSYRDDMRQYFSRCLIETNELYNLSMGVALEKGVNSRHPYIELPKRTDFVDSKKYYSGINPFGDKRPLNAIEISHLYFNVMTNSLGIKLCLAFAQTSPTKDVQQFMLRGREISKKDMQIFADMLVNENIEPPHLPDVGVSNSAT